MNNKKHLVLRVKSITLTMFDLILNEYICSISPRACHKSIETLYINGTHSN